MGQKGQGGVFRRHLRGEVIRFIHENKDKPFFLYYASQLPHGPVAIPAIDPEVANNPNLTTIEKEYASMIKKLDDTVGRILAAVDREGLSENTIIVFAADNGLRFIIRRKGGAKSLIATRQRALRLIILRTNTIVNSKVMSSTATRGWQDSSGAIRKVAYTFPRVLRQGHHPARGKSRMRSSPTMISAHDGRNAQHQIAQCEGWQIVSSAVDW